MKNNFLLALILIIFSTTLLAQVDPQTQLYRDDPLGDKTYRKKGILDGNLIRTIFRNDGQVGSWPDRPSGEWPKGTGHSYLDGCTPIITAKVIAPGNNQVIHPVQTSYREEVDIDPSTGELWVVEPVPGYANSSSEEPAISTKSSTWPDTWPRSLPRITSEWDGSWYGYFGRDVLNADVEAFYVYDDSKDREFFRPPYSYQPILSNPERGGLGIRVETRGFQWSHVLAEDIIFWHYEIFNLADADYDSTLFGFYCDTGVGGVDDNGDDNSNYSTILDLAYAFDNDGKAPPDQWATGYVGYAFLESPGNSFNGINDDEDTDINGVPMTDEKRDDGLDNDGDWVPFLDINGNGVWDAEEHEPLNNDVGQDGVGPFDPQYTNPDVGEGDGVPTLGEPNFDITDKDESDQIGLTSLAIERLTNKGPTAIWPKNDDVIWEKMNYATFDTTIKNSNIQILFGSGPFPLKINTSERFSVALVFGTDYEDMVFNKETVQQIYNANYNFAKPPYKPTLTAVAGDKKVFLFWNSISEESRDPFLGFEQGNPTLGYKKDFEGYMIYRSQEAEFQDIKTITDSKGEPKYWKPIAQFDLKDGIEGPDPVGINGAHFWRGDETGLQHSYIDEDIVNGQKYYYALVAYDQGDPLLGTKGLIPSENTKIITEDLVGNVQFVDINTAVLVPNAPASGYIPPQIIGDLSRVTEGFGTGSMDVVLLSQAEVKDGAVYKVIFTGVDTIPYYRTKSYTLTRELNGVIDTIFAEIDSASFSGSKLGTPFDGISVIINNPDSISVDQENSGWVSGFSTLNMPISPDVSNGTKDIAWPSDYELEFLGDYTAETRFTHIPINFIARNITGGYDIGAEILDNDESGSFNLGDEILLLETSSTITSTKYTWKVGWFEPIGVPFTVFPEAGDIFRIQTKKYFNTGDYFVFSTKSAAVDNTKAKDDLDKIGVVPNPYITSNSWERRNLNQTGRGERRIDFINLPAECTIRIYTVAGALVKTLYKNTSATEGAISWNLVSEDGMDIAYGLYVYHVDAPGVGEKIGKFAIIK
ncbi:MAG: hypothetical protein IPJ03_12935 [Ignavibacteriales bacterium]|nr:hypothetical protein [Ignavibacteriales bacterium]